MRGKCLIAFLMLCQTHIQKGLAHSIEPEITPQISHSYGTDVSKLLPRRLALVLDIDRYQYWDALQNPIFDANAVGNILKEVYGHEVWRLASNPTVDDIINAIDSLSKQNLTGPMDQIFVFFSGHGFVDPFSGNGHLIASDS